MNESTRTLTFVAVAVALLGWAWAAGPRKVATLVGEQTGAFFPDWKDPLAASNLEVVEYDEDTGTVHPFKVLQIDGKWSIPSHSNYPTDAERQLGEAAASVFELKKLSLVTNQKSEHETYGVIDPDPQSLKGGEKGVGKRVTLEDKQGKKLAQFIIGKEDKAGIRFVRVPGQDAVYRAEMRPEKLSTKFGDWIEKDLLKMSNWDIKEIVLNSYSLDEQQGRIVPADVLKIAYEGDSSKWTLDGLQEGEELNTENLNKLKTALDDLKIVDVRRKPEGLSQELKEVESIQLDAEAVMSLRTKGFYIDRGRLLSNEGETLVTMKDGVVYTLRFGEIAANTGGPAEKKEPAADGSDKSEEASGANRYIFVMAQFDESVIPKPELKPVPGEALPKLPDDKTNDAAAEPAKEETKADEAKADEKKDEAKKDETSEEPKSRRDVDRERQEVEKENKRKQDEYNDKVKKGQDRVKELNARFADWYYVIPDGEYKKIHLSRADIVKQKEGAKSEDKTGVESFNKLKQEGLKDE